MPIIVPSGSPSEVDITEELRLQRKNTEMFILYAPTQLALTPTVETRTASGAVTTTDGETRPTQIFRLIPMSHTERPQGSTSGLTSAGNGVQRRHDFTILGYWDAMMAAGDWWSDELGMKWIIDEMVPHNRYETRGLVTAYGRTK